MSKIDLEKYRCECGAKFKRFGRKNLKQYICEKCGHYITEENLYQYKIK